MKKIIISTTGMLLEQIDKHVQKWGFKSRAELFRFAVIEFMRNEARTLPSDETLKEYTKAIRSVKAGQGNQFLV